MTTPNTAPQTWTELDEYLKATHLAGKTVTVTISRIEFRTLHPTPGHEEIKPVLFFQDKQKGLILTSTNQKFLHSFFGDAISASYGAQVQLKAIQKKVAGKLLDTIIIMPI